jgi:modulator of FtsH protease
MQRIDYSVVRSGAAGLATNKVIKNTFALLSMTLLFSAAVAGVSMAFNWPHPGVLLTLAGYFGLLILTQRLANSAWGLLSVFALTGFMGLTLGPIISN